MVARRKNLVPPPAGECPLGKSMSLLGGAWTPNIIWYLSMNPRRFSELKSDIPGISAKILATRLKQLVGNGVVEREVIPTSPPTVEYRLTDLGLQLKPAIAAIVEVGHRLKLRKVAPKSAANE